MQARAFALTPNYSCNDHASQRHRDIDSEQRLEHCEDNSAGRNINDFPAYARSNSQGKCCIYFLTLYKDIGLLL